MMYVRYPLSLRQVEDLLFERGINICHETVHFWWNRFGPMFAAEIRKRRVVHHSYSNWRWHLDPDIDLGGAKWGMGARPSPPDSLPVVARLPNNPRVILAFGHGP